MHGDLVRALAIALAIAGCSPTKSEKPAPSASAAAKATAAPPPGIEAIERLRGAVEGWRTCEADAAYGELRRAAAAAEPFFRAFARTSGEVVYGPLRPSDEGAGAIGVADAAIGTKDCARIDKQRQQLRSAIVLGREEMRGDKAPREARAAQGASDASYELGLALLEARMSTSAHDVGRRGEALGLVDAITALAPVALGATPPDLSATLSKMRAEIERSATFAALADRGRLARTTGAIGFAVREAAREKAVAVRPPYRRLSADRAISALDLPPPRTPLDVDLVALGLGLFRDVRLSKASTRSCASCHDPARAFTEDRAAPTSLDPKVDILRNTPTLLYAGLHAAQLWDGRVVTLESQALRVVHAKAELGLDDAELAARVAKDEGYASAFAQKQLPIDAKSIGKALGAYVASLGDGTSPVDAYARGEDAALTPELARGLDVFVAKGRCARCHVPPLWGGSRPTDFAVAVYAVVGAPKRIDAREIDPDPGRFGVTHKAKDKGAFKTPTLRDVAVTAPYMHHGAYPTLEAVVDLYDKGGGRGVGVEVENQDPDVLPLKLTPEERAALLTFLRAGLLDRGALP